MRMVECETSLELLMTKSLRTLYNQGVVCLVQDHGALEVPQMAIGFRVPLEWCDGRRCELLQRCSLLHLVVKGQGVDSINFPAQSYLRASLSWRPWSRSFTSLSTCSTQRAGGLGRCLRCLKRRWITSFSTSKG
ncbi:unnamed protein product [Prunus armeniaca]